jgi:hypothetical protein
MKNYITLLFVILSAFSFAQNQAESALSWKDGSYMYWANFSGNEYFNWNKQSESEVQFTKGPDGLVNTVIIGTDVYVKDSEEGSRYVAYFKNTSRDWNLYFTSSSIVVFGLTEDDGEIDIKMRGSYGKTLGGKATKWENKIRKAIIAGRAEQGKAEYMSFDGQGLGIKDKEISKVELTLVPFESDELVSGGHFTIGVKTTLSDGTEVVSKNLGGLQSGDDYRFNVEGAARDYAKDDKVNQEDVYRLFSCEAIEHGGVKIQVINEYTKEVEHEEIVSVECQESSNPLAKKALVFTKYDEVYVANKYGYSKVASIKVLYDKGFEEYIDRLSAIFEEDYPKNLVIVAIDGKKGLATLQGESFVECKYTDVALSFRYGLLELEKGNKRGYVNEEGEIVIPVQYKNTEVCEGGYVLVSEDDKWGYLNTDGSVKIPLKYDYLGELNEGLISVRKGEKYGFMDVNQKIKIPYAYEDVEEFSEGLAAVKIEGKWGFINKSGELKIEAKYDRVGSFYYGRAWVDNGDSSVDGEIDTQGNETWTPVPVKTTPTASSSSSSSSSSSNASTFTIVNKTGNMINLMDERGNGEGSLNNGSSKTFNCDETIYQAHLNANKSSWNVRGRLIGSGDNNCGQTIEFK